MRIGLEHAMAEQRMELGHRLCCVERCCVRRDAIGRERCLDFWRDRALRQGMWERLEVCVVFESEVRAFVGFDQGEDLRGRGYTISDASDSQIAGTGSPLGTRASQCEV